MNYEIFNEDCLEGMKKISDGSVDLVLTDLPFGTTESHFDNKIPFAPMWQHFWRVAKKNAAVVLFSQMPFGSDLIQSQRKLFRYEIIWEKPKATGILNSHKMPLRCHENILIFYRKLPTYNPQWTYGKPYSQIQQSIGTSYGWRRCREERKLTVSEDGRRYPRDIQKFNQPICSHEKTFHPTQKPTDLLEYLIRTYTDEGETVLDATMGSGSTGVACVNTNRNFIGFELEQKFYDIALKRISTAMDKQSQALF